MRTLYGYGSVRAIFILKSTGSTNQNPLFFHFKILHPPGHVNVSADKSDHTDLHYLVDHHECHSYEYTDYTHLRVGS